VNLAAGTHVTCHGYLRIHRMPNRGQYEHRQVMIELLRIRNPWGFDRIPAGWTVHHIDHDKRNNDPQNLVLCGPGLHFRAHHNGKRALESDEMAYLQELAKGNGRASA